jgi:hypothetical protein
MPYGPADAIDTAALRRVLDGVRILCDRLELARK